MAKRSLIPRGKSLTKIAYVTFVILKSHYFLLWFFKDFSDFLCDFSVISQRFVIFLCFQERCTKKNQWFVPRLIRCIIFDRTGDRQLYLCKDHSTWRPKRRLELPKHPFLLSTCQRGQKLTISPKLSLGEEERFLSWRNSKKTCVIGSHYWRKSLAAYTSCNAITQALTDSFPYFLRSHSLRYYS